MSGGLTPSATEHEGHSTDSVGQAGLEADQYRFRVERSFSLLRSADLLIWATPCGSVGYPFIRRVTRLTRQQEEESA
jgi:hypothetical protein